MIHVYTGKGKGKTTAALGLALRASGAGLKVYIGQFVKGRCYSEIKALRKLKNIKLEQFGRSCFIRRRPSPKDIEIAKNGFARIEEIIRSRKYDMVILDEINIALKFKLIKSADLLGMLKKCPRKTEIILTGRCAPVSVVKIADLVSDIREVKHYYQKGRKARRGIEF